MPSFYRSSRRPARAAATAETGGVFLDGAARAEVEGRSSSGRARTAGVADASRTVPEPEVPMDDSFPFDGPFPSSFEEDVWLTGRLVVRVLGRDGRPRAGRPVSVRACGFV